MSRIYDNWERLVAATLKKEQLRDLAYCESLSSRASDFSSDSFHEDVAVSLFSSDKSKVDDRLATDGAPEALLKQIKEPIGIAATKASLSAIFQLVHSSATFSNKNAAPYFAEIGIVPVLIETLMESERSICEKALGILDGICSCSEGLEKAYENALTLPVVVKKILRVSVLANQFSVSILQKLGKNENRGRGVILGAVELGAFHRLAVLLQIGCDETTKKNATELLNLYRDVTTICSEKI
ncbi:Ubiquitin--protein ligase [Handroanthus impetiginosus]|uniref:U-box domain-containing protein n=1 Tax=Handroanthus impetiginosus TaxID=429701 RepID=A0A2G9I5B5_9LAMI|nr:Ubiquitin--protein ligase [Handroanthus impetiginosus]